MNGHSVIKLKVQFETLQYILSQNGVKLGKYLSPILLCIYAMDSRNFRYRYKSLHNACIVVCLAMQTVFGTRMSKFMQVTLTLCISHGNLS